MNTYNPVGNLYIKVKHKFWTDVFTLLITNYLHLGANWINPYLLLWKKLYIFWNYSEFKINELENNTNTSNNTLNPKISLLLLWIFWILIQYLIYFLWISPHEFWNVIHHHWLQLYALSNVLLNILSYPNSYTWSNDL